MIGSFFLVLLLSRFLFSLPDPLPRKFVAPFVCVKIESFFSGKGFKCTVERVLFFYSILSLS